MRTLAAVVAFAASGSALCPPSRGRAALNARASALPTLQAYREGSAAAAREAARAARAGEPGVHAPPHAPPQWGAPPPQRGPPPPQWAQPPPPDYGAPYGGGQALPPDYGAPYGGGPAPPQDYGAPYAGGAAPPQDYGAPYGHGAAAAAAEDARWRGLHASKAQMDDGVAAVLTEFCESGYARSACSYCNANPTDVGKIWGMFGSVVRSGDTLTVSLESKFEQRSRQLLYELAKHLHARMPELRQLQCEKSSPPSTETILLAGVPARAAM